MANIITGIRIICSIAILFFPALSPAFYILYITAGVSDMIDGTVADFVLVIICLIKLLPVLHVSTWLIIWIIVIAVIKAINLLSGYVLRKEIVTSYAVENTASASVLRKLGFEITQEIPYECSHGEIITTGRICRYTTR